MIVLGVLGFVQAGGGSTRFGTDKALAKIAGKTMLQRTGELLAGVCDSVTVVAPKGKYVDLPWDFTPDFWPGEGPLGGILSALLRLTDSISPNESHAAGDELRALILSCDMPFLTSEFLAYLRERVSRSDALVVVPQSANGLEPLCAAWNPRAVVGLQSAFDSGVRKVTQAMKQLPMEVLDESTWKRFDKDNRLFWNMNTPADFEEARRILEAPER
jgi:molybdopterin-guanine dinucleotide biosynthesis protein A